MLAEILAAEGFPATAAAIADAIDRQITVEAPLTGVDYEAIFETLNRTCPSTLYRLHRALREDQAYLRRVTGG